MSETLDNPFRSPDEGAQPDIVRGRNPWMVALLTMLAGVMGLVYCGRLRRALAWQLCSFLASLIAAGCLLYWLEGRAAVAIAVVLILLPWPLLLIDSVWVARRTTSVPRKWYQQWWAYLLIYLLLIGAGNGAAYLIRASWLEAFVLPTRNMSPAIRPGDRILVEKTGPSPTALRRGAIVLFVYRNTSMGETQNRIQRIIGLPGDTVEIVDEQVIVNGQPLDEPYAVPLSDEAREYAYMEPTLLNLEAYEIPEGHLFLLGDNRGRSMDSRMLGPTAIGDVVGLARIIYWSSHQPSDHPDEAGQNADAEEGVRWDRLGQRLDHEIRP